MSVAAIDHKLKVARENGDAAAVDLLFDVATALKNEVSADNTRKDQTPSHHTPPHAKKQRYRTKKSVARKKESREQQTLDTFFGCERSAKRPCKRSETDAYFMDCPTCEKPVMYVEAEGFHSCPTCGYAQKATLMSCHRRMRTGDVTGINTCSTNYVTSFSYKRSNHFRDWLQHVTATESRIVPREVYTNVLCELKKRRVLNPSLISESLVRQTLKRLGYTAYYENVVQITDKITGREPCTLDRDTTQKLMHMFKEIQEPFEKHKPATRVNFFSYSYCLYKFLQLLGKDKYLSRLTLLKSRQKLYDTDQLWKKICKTLHWQFIPTT